MERRKEKGVEEVKAGVKCDIVAEVSKYKAASQGKIEFKVMDTDGGDQCRRPENVA